MNKAPALRYETLQDKLFLPSALFFTSLRVICIMASERNSSCTLKGVSDHEHPDL